MSAALRDAVLRNRGPLIRAALAGFVAGTVATVAQMLLWWASATPVVDTLLRDARLTAAIVMGRAVLASGQPWRWDVLLMATLIHFGLCFIYAALALPLVVRRSPAFTLLAGAAYGVAIYAVNLYGFTQVFPWFEVSRGAVTLLTHIVFGASLTWACRYVGLAGKVADVGPEIKGGTHWPPQSGL